VSIGAAARMPRRSSVADAARCRRSEARGAIVNHFRNLLRQQPRNVRLLRYFGNDPNGRRAYDAAVAKILAADLNKLFTFVAHK
jgi:hypothetical protein